MMCFPNRNCIICFEASALAGCTGACVGTFISATSVIYFLRSTPVKAEFTFQVAQASKENRDLISYPVFLFKSQASITGGSKWQKTKNAPIPLAHAKPGRE